ADSQTYLDLAENLRAGRGLVEQVAGGGFEPTILRPPGYPAFLAACPVGFGKGTSGVLFVQCLLVLASLEADRRICSRRVGGAAGGVVFVAAAGAVPAGTHVGRRLGSEALAMALRALSFALLDEPRPTAGRGFLAGAALGLASLARQHLAVGGLALAFWGALQ